ncbi:hypothetical protein [Kosakonia cowanii]|uniref:hypothetical protein n=1 Tax=Kosakonia cowanii TaxID=208223 RepID=UPI00289DE5CD|nr:hypothetical protein [Kosakonia cowanii]
MRKESFLKAFYIYIEKTPLCLMLGDGQEKMMKKSVDMDDFVQFVRDELGEGNWVPLYKNMNKDDESEDGSLYSCLIAPEETEKAMQEYGWDLLPGDGGPSIVSSGSTNIWYESNCSKCTPLVIYRDFYGRRDSYHEILQELVLYLDLYHDAVSCKYVVDDENGVEIDVIKYSEQEIVIRKSFLRAFMSAKQMNLLLFFENSRHKKGSEKLVDERINEPFISFTRFWDNSYIKGFDTFTRVLGKKLFKCLPRTKENYSPFKIEKNYESFIIEGDAHDNREYSSDPSKLSNYFGGNPGAPHYLTPVYFDKAVLQKYFGASSQYEVQDSVIYKHGYWRLRFDNNSPNHVCVFLGDLGKDIPHSEAVYWKSFNIPPEERVMSGTYFKRSILGNFADAESPDLLFKFEFERFQDKWLEQKGWPLFLPLVDADKHCFKTLHSLTKNEQSEFDSQILSLVKITIDSINVKKLKEHVSIDESGSIKLLSTYLKANGVKFDTASFFGGLQGVRSTGVAHRRGSQYEKTIERLGIDNGTLIQAFDHILEQTTELLREIKHVFINVDTASKSVK